MEGRANRNRGQARSASGPSQCSAHFCQVFIEDYFLDPPHGLPPASPNNALSPEAGYRAGLYSQSVLRLTNRHIPGEIGNNKVKTGQGVLAPQGLTLQYERKF
jgi:hypothetical protein